MGRCWMVSVILVNLLNIMLMRVKKSVFKQKLLLLSELGFSVVLKNIDIVIKVIRFVCMDLKMQMVLLCFMSSFFCFKYVWNSFQLLRVQCLWIRVVGWFLDWLNGVVSFLESFFLMWNLGQVLVNWFIEMYWQGLDLLYQYCFWFFWDVIFCKKLVMFLCFGYWNFMFLKKFMMRLCGF